MILGFNIICNKKGQNMWKNTRYVHFANNS